jgi:hypothetical protein
VAARGSGGGHCATRGESLAWRYENFTFLEGGTVHLSVNR